MNRNRKIYGLLSLLTLILGIVLYLLFRDLNNILLFTYIPKHKIFETILIPLKSSIITDILRYNLPDMLWLVSAILFFRFIWYYKIKIQIAYVLSFYAIGFILEISQLSENVFGTFDRLDLLFFGIGAFVEGLLYKTFILRRFL